MRKTILLAVAMIISLAAFSQNNNGAPRGNRGAMNPEQMAMMQTEMLNKVVALDSIQFQAVFLMNYSDAMAMQDSIKVNRERREQMKKEGKERRERVQPSAEERRARNEVMAKRRALRDEQMKQILNEEQYKKYQEYMKQAGERFRGQGRPGRQGRPGGRRDAQQ